MTYVVWGGIVRIYSIGTKTTRKPPTGDYCFPTQSFKINPRRWLPGYELLPFPVPSQRIPGCPLVGKIQGMTFQRKNPFWGLVLQVWKKNKFKCYLSLPQSYCNNKEGVCNLKIFIYLRSHYSKLLEKPHLCYSTVTCKVFIKSTSTFLNCPHHKLGQSCANRKKVSHTLKVIICLWSNTLLLPWGQTA